MNFLIGILILYFGPTLDITSAHPESNSVIAPGRENHIRNRRSDDAAVTEQLFTAIRSDQADKVSELIRNGADVNARMGTETPLLIAMENGRESIVNLLIEKGANVHAESERVGDTPLHMAAVFGHEKVAEILVRNGANIDVLNRNRHTPLHSGVIFRKDKVIEFLIKKGANVNTVDKDGDTPLYLAVVSGQDKVVDLLIGGGADVNAAYGGAGDAPLHQAAVHGNVKIADSLIRHGANINLLNKNGHTPLHSGVIFGQEKVADLLIQKGSNIDTVDIKGYTPLLEAVHFGNEGIVELLMNNGANPNIKDRSGQTAKDLAISKGFTRIVNLLEGGSTVAIRACAVYSEIITDRILGGDIAEAGEFPWMAALGYLNGNYKISFDCGGTVISDYFILTAAHCTTLSRRPVIVRLGKLSLTEEGETRTENRQIHEIIRHPNYSITEKKNDLSLIRVTRRIWFTDSIRPACLQTDLRDEEPSVKLTVLGWGILASELRDRPDVLRKADLITMPLSQCNTTFLDYNRGGGNQKAFRDGISPTQYCAYDPDGRRDSCQGDSGGPLQLYPKGAKMPKLVGIVSFGIGCGSTLPGIYTRVASYLNWIAPIVWPNGEVTTQIVRSDN